MTALFLILKLITQLRRLGPEAAVARSNQKLNGLAFFEAFVTVTDDATEVDEYVRATFAFDKAETFGCVEPLYCTLYFVIHDWDSYKCKKVECYCFGVTWVPN